MPSPFPGMDPYIEARERWRDFHVAFLAACREELNARLPEHYAATVDERTRLVEVNEEQIRAVIPDVAITLIGPGRLKAQQTSGGVATLEPQEIPLPVFEEVRERRVKIHTLPKMELVTVIELLSPTNKSPNHFGDYLSKRDAVLSQPVHLLEIDLLLQGKRLPLLRSLPPGDYYALLSRADRRPICDVYSWSLRDPLPTLPVPLKAPDGDVPLDLGKLLTMAYDSGRYRQLLRYDRQADLPVSDADRAWMAEIAAAAR